jgi:protein TonB
MAQSKTRDRWNIALFGLAWFMGVLVLIALAWWFFVSQMRGSGAVAKKAPKISLLPSTPPPPPPPPKEEKKPEPPKEQKEMKVDQVEKKAEPPADPAIKMEGAAGDGPSIFAAGKVTNEDLSRVGATGGATVGGPAVSSPLVNPFNTYAAAIKTELQRHLARRSELKRRQYQVEVRVWVAEDGRLKNFELMGTTTDGETDDAIRSALAKLPAFSDPPPARMPQPIRLRLVASGRA